MAEVCQQGLFVRREAGKDQKLAVLEQIKERQQLALQGLKRPISIYPEGATTNG